MAEREDPLAVIAAKVIADDPELRDELRAMVREIIAQTRRTVRIGLPRDRLALQRALVPQFLKAMTRADAEAGDDAEKQAHEELMAELRGDTPEGGTDAGT